MTPTPEEIVDTWGAVEQGGDPVRLAEVCRREAKRYEGAGRQRLLTCAAALDWTAQFLAILDGDHGAEDGHAEC